MAHRVKGAGAPLVKLLQVHSVVKRVHPLGVAHRGDVLRPAPGGWLPVEYGGEPGWVSARYVEAVE